MGTNTTQSFGWTGMSIAVVVSLIVGILGGVWFGPEKISASTQASIDQTNKDLSSCQSNVATLTNQVNTVNAQATSCASALATAQNKSVSVSTGVSSDNQNVSSDYLNEVTNLFWDKLKTNQAYDNYLKCGGVRYDFDQLSLSLVYDNAAVSFDKVNSYDLSQANSHTTTEKIRVKYVDPDTNVKCYNTFNVKGVFTDGESPVLTLS